MAISKAVIDGNLPRVVDNVSQEITAINTHAFDLSQNLNLQQLAENLRSSISTRRASSRLTIWGGNRQLAKQELDLRQQQMLLQEIQNLALGAEAMANTQAKLFLIPEMINAVINGHKAEIELARRRFLDSLQEIEDTARARYLENDRKEAEIERMKVDNHIAKLIGEAQASDINSKTRFSNALADLLEELKDSMNFDEITPSQAFMLAKILNPSDNSGFDTSDKDELFEQELAKIKTENKILKAKAKAEKWSTKKKVNDIETEIGDDEGTTGGPISSR